jgi:hypothetical protein
MDSFSLSKQKSSWVERCQKLSFNSAKLTSAANCSVQGESWIILHEELGVLMSPSLLLLVRGSPSLIHKQIPSQWSVIKVIRRLACMLLSPWHTKTQYCSIRYLSNSWIYMTFNPPSSFPDSGPVASRALQWWTLPTSYISALTPLPSKLRLCPLGKSVSHQWWFLAGTEQKTSPMVCSYADCNLLKGLHWKAEWPASCWDSVWGTYGRQSGLRIPITDSAV